MPKYLTQEQRTLGDMPPTPAGNEALGGRVRSYRATIALDALTISSSQVAATGLLATDTISLFRIPAGMRFLRGQILTSVSLGTSTVAIGIAGTPAKYRAAAVFTAVDTPTLFGTAAGAAAVPIANEEEIILTPAVATLPTTAGARLVIDMEFVGP